MDYSVLMSVYYKENPEYLRLSIESMFNQTVKLADFVLVCDGPLNEGLDKVIEDMILKYTETLKVVRLEKNGGLGNALNEGIKHCKMNLVARMDSDDIARNDRCERQLKVFEDNSELSIVSGTIEEFDGDIENITGKRILPETNEEILEFSKGRNPFNHPCVMYKKDAVEKAGGYKDFYLLEDYYLWLRMLMNGCKGYNIKEPLLWMRSGEALYKRRGGSDYYKSQKALLKFMLDKGYINKLEHLKGKVVRFAGAHMPNSMRGKVYKKYLREQGSE